MTVKSRDLWIVRAGPGTSKCKNRYISIQRRQDKLNVIMVEVRVQDAAKRVRRQESDDDEPRSKATQGKKIRSEMKSRKGATR